MPPQEFAQRLIALLPETKAPFVPIGSFPLHDGLWVRVAEVTRRESDPFRVAKVAGLFNQQDSAGEIHFILNIQDSYTEEDVARAVALIIEADGLSVSAEG